MTELLDTNTLIKRLRYQGRQYAAGQASRGGNSGPHMLEQAADQLEIALAEGDALRAKLDELAKQEHAAFVNEQGFIVERDDMQISSGEKLYLAAGARPVEPAPAAVQSAAARWWSLEDIALQMRLSKSHVAQQIVCQPGFPTPVPRSKQPRWVARDVVAWFEGE